MRKEHVSSICNDFSEFYHYGWETQYSNLIHYVFFFFFCAIVYALQRGTIREAINPENGASAADADAGAAVTGATSSSSSFKRYL
jgi:hypothetical protein